ncbi:PREDICTED: uncharacterized protein LOC109162338 [Ipomoea nil]|uniref:uncharacterized protein LOC109162338 n=1 Tax=Ipomoea nil TaxID=35883 RepID=UPI0009011DE3|nr:PREDICTED: uncharacterized protein LOC109162338 [Ipomoea nil]
MGDFNSVVTKEETTNYSSFSTQRSLDFVSWIHDEGFIDLGFSRPKLTWVMDGSKDAIKGARLDRALCNSVSRCDDGTPASICLKSCSLLLRLHGGKKNTTTHHFRFQAAWLTHEDLQKMVFGNIHKRKRVLMSRLGGIQWILANNFHSGLVKLEKRLQVEMEDIIYQEELMWFQRSREDWITSGDRNTAFYHAATTIRNSRNKVTRLLDDSGT